MTLHQQYNQLLTREHKAWDYLHNERIPRAERERWEGEYTKIVDGLETLLGQIGPSTTAERLNGFALA